jgi:uncharacterized circularly permuted ATP-grasp superfamily protein
MHTADGTVRDNYRRYTEWLNATSNEAIARKREEADIAFHRVGITFAVYGEETGQERLIPFDIVPRIIPAHEWKRIADGLRQRVKALNAFLHDIYHYPDLLLNNLRSVAPRGVTNPNVVVLTPGQFNSAYFEHAFLAQQMGV